MYQDHWIFKYNFSIAVVQNEKKEKKTNTHQPNMTDGFLFLFFFFSIFNAWCSFMGLLLFEWSKLILFVVCLPRQSYLVCIAHNKT